MKLLQLKVPMIHEDKFENKTFCDGGSFEHWDKGDPLKQIITIEKFEEVKPSVSAGIEGEEDRSMEDPLSRDNVEEKEQVVHAHADQINKQRKETNKNDVQQITREVKMIMVDKVIGMQYSLNLVVKITAVTRNSVKDPT